MGNVSGTKNINNTIIFDLPTANPSEAVTSSSTNGALHRIVSLDGFITLHGISLADWKASDAVAVSLRGAFRTMLSLISRVHIEHTKRVHPRGSAFLTTATIHSTQFDFTRVVVQGDAKLSTMRVSERILASETGLESSIFADASIRVFFSAMLKPAQQKYAREILTHMQHQLTHTRNLTESIRKAMQASSLSSILKSRWAQHVSGLGNAKLSATMHFTDARDNGHYYETTVLLPTGIRQGDLFLFAGQHSIPLIVKVPSVPSSLQRLHGARNLSVRVPSIPSPTPAQMQIIRAAFEKVVVKPPPALLSSVADGNNVAISLTASDGRVIYVRVPGSVLTNGGVFEVEIPASNASMGMAYFSLLTIANAARLTRTAVCPFGWTEFNDACYLVDRARYSSPEHEIRCLAHGGLSTSSVTRKDVHEARSAEHTSQANAHLASIMNSDEREFVLDLITPGADTWIGVSYAFEVEPISRAEKQDDVQANNGGGSNIIPMDPDFGWIWHDPDVAYESTAGQYRAWGPDQPSYRGRVQSEHNGAAGRHICVAMRRMAGDAYNARWIALDCDVKLEAVCKRAKEAHMPSTTAPPLLGSAPLSASETPSPSNLPTSPPTSWIDIRWLDKGLSCDRGWTLFQKTRSCYKVLLNAGRSHEQETRCLAHGAHIVSILTSQENAFVYTLAQAPNTWIGLRNALVDLDSTWAQNTQRLDPDYGWVWYDFSSVQYVIRIIQ